MTRTHACGKAHEHTFERFELKGLRPVYAAGVFKEYVQEPYYIGYHCRCGEPGYSLNLTRAVRSGFAW